MLISDNKRPVFFFPVFIFLILLIALVADACGIIRERTGTDHEGYRTHGALHVRGSVLYDENEHVVQLRGFSTHGILWYPEYTGSASMQTVKKYGANVMRLAVYSDENRGYIYYPQESLKTVFGAIDHAMEQGIYVVVDWHVLRDENPLKHMDAAKEFFTSITERYGNHEAILYEICNEPCGDTDWADITEYADEVIPLIRSNAPDSVILVGTPHYSSSLQEAMENPLPYDNLLYSYHEYIDVTTDGTYEAVILQQAIDAGLPIFVSEWGISDIKNPNGKMYESRAFSFASYLEEHHISWCYWSLCNKDEVYSVIQPECGKYGGWEKEDLTFSGKVVVKILEE